MTRQNDLVEWLKSELILNRQPKPAATSNGRKAQ